MKLHRFSVIVISAALLFILYGPEAAAAKTEIKGAAILEHPCGKVAVKQMGLVHAGNMDEANKLSTKEMQDQWKTMPAKDRTMMSGMMKEMSQTEAQYAADIKANGVLVVDDKAATLTVKKTPKDKNGTSTETITQNFKIDGGQCLISR
jgi:mannose/fructose/N-acetylgalactosamine-specific phosphotransferase system component IIB